MPRYHYTAVAKEGKKSKGTITAESSYAARKQLRVRNIHPTKLSELKTGIVGKSRIFSIFGGRKTNQLIDFTKQMATLLKSGIKLTEALSVLTQQTSDVRFKSAISDIHDRVVTGESFSEALKDYGDYFDIVYVSMIRVGEVNGSLGEIFDTIATFMGKRHRVESKVITAMVYPLFLIFFCVVAVLILTTYVKPKIGNQIVMAGQELP